MSTGQRQDSLDDQLATVASEAERVGLVSVVTWLRGGPIPASRDDVWLARKLAIGHGCYDADDWIEQARKTPA